MKKSLKHTGLLVVTLLCLFGFLSNVKADDECSDIKDYNGDVSDVCRIGERSKLLTSGPTLNVYHNLGYSGNTTTHKIIDPAKYDITINGNAGKASATYSDIGVTFTSNGRDLSSKAYWSAYRDSYSPLYCLDPQLAGKDNLYAERFLNNSGTKEHVQAYDIAIIAILSSNSYNSATITEYWSKLLAIRALNLTFGFQTSGSDTVFKAIQTVTHNWNEGNWNVSALNEELNKYGLGLKNVSAIGGYNFTGSPVNEGKNYYDKGLEAARKYLQNKKTEGKVEKTNLVQNAVKTETDANGIKVSQDIVYTFKVTGEPKKFVINGIKFKDDKVPTGLHYAITGITGHGIVYANSETEATGYIGKNLLTESGNDGTEITVTVTLSGYKSSNKSSIELLKCDEAQIEYFLDVTYEIDNDDEFSDYVATIWYSGDSEEQRYVGIEKRTKSSLEGNKISFYVKDKTKLIAECSCDSFKADCEEEYSNTHNLNGSACTLFKNSNCGCAYYEFACNHGDQNACKYVDENCKYTCDSSYDSFECCDENGQHLLVSPLDDKEVGIYGPKDVKACFVNKVDTQCGDSNSSNCTNVAGVRDQKSNTYSLSSMKTNKYCEVSCKEDYLMTMPTAKLVNAGRYFTFTAKVGGSKVCYTNTIQREQYNKDILAAQENMINAYRQGKDLVQCGPPPHLDGMNYIMVNMIILKVVM